jgi:MatE
MVRLETTLLCALPLSAYAFSSSRTFPNTAAIPSTRGSRFALANDPRGFLLEDDAIPKTEETPIMAEVETVGNAAEVSEELFLARIEKEAPASVLLAEEESTPVFTFTAQNNTETIVSNPGTPINNPDITENVEAVMQASENAMVYAEAALPVEVRSALKAANSTTFSKDNVDLLPAKKVVGEPATQISTPSLMKILKFAIPAIGVWLCAPMLSLIDTSAVGVLSGTTQQAALNPAVAVTDYAALLIAFLYTATTNLIASAEESDRTLPGKPKTTSAMLGAMQMSTYVGLGLGTALFVFARPLLKAIIGNDAINPAVFAAAMKYVRIRALGMPAAAIIGSAQAGSLGAKDTSTPLKVLFAAAVVNFFGDALFVGCKHPFIGGAAGAAWGKWRYGIRFGRVMTFSGSHNLFYHFFYDSHGYLSVRCSRSFYPLAHHHQTKGQQEASQGCRLDQEHYGFHGQI